MSNTLDINPKLGCVTCENVIEKKSKIKYIYNSQDGWFFLCGDKCHYDESCKGDEFLAIHVSHVINDDYHIYNIFISLEEGYEAYLRDVGTWEIVKAKY